MARAIGSARLDLVATGAMPDELQFLVLGPVEARVRGRACPLGGPKQRALFGALVLAGNQPVSLARLAALLWEDPPVSATANLRTYAAGLRRVVGRRLVARDGAYLLSAEPGESDLERFTTLVTQARTLRAEHDLPGALARFDEALALWRAPSGHDLRDHSPVSRHLLSLNEQRLLAIEECLQVRLQRGEATVLVAGLRTLLSEHPTRERLWASLMLALYRSGDISGALSAFADAKQALDVHLGMDPGIDLTTLHHRILNRDAALEVDRAPPPEPGPRAAAVVPRQLPRDTRILVGRDAALRDVLAAGRAGPRDVGRPVVVAIDGPGGVGKSAFAVRAAHQLAADYPDGQLYVDLCGARAGIAPLPANRVLARFLHALGDRGWAGDDVDECAARFRDLTAGRRLLLVLDNAAETPQVLPLLPGASQCTVIVTSRRRLATLEASHRVRLDVLDERDAEQVLWQGSGLTPTPDSAAARVAQLCGGLPLALRVAAARLAARTDHTMHDLAARLADDRHRLDELGVEDLSVRASLAASYEMLRGSPAAVDQLAVRLFGLMSVLRVPEYGLGTLAALVDEPGHDVDRAVLRLAELHLVELEPVEPHPVEPHRGRYGLHDLLRLFAAERARELIPAAERDAARARAYWYLADAATRARGFVRPVDVEDTPPPNPLRAAAPCPCRSLADSLTWLETERETLKASVRQLADDGAAAEGRYTLLLVRAQLVEMERNGRWNEALEPCRALVDLGVRIGDPRLSATGWRMIAAMYQRTQRQGEALRCIRTSVGLCREVGDPVGLAQSLNALGIIQIEAGALSDAEATLTEALRHAERGGRRDWVGIVMNSLGRMNRCWGRYEAAMPYLDGALRIRRECGDRIGECHTLQELAGALLMLGRPDEAWTRLSPALAIAIEVGGHDLERQVRMLRMQVLAGRGEDQAVGPELAAALTASRAGRDEQAVSEVLEVARSLGHPVAGEGR